ncbi:hypothetical protein ACT691_19885 [Vibrio metschnikovii]
MALALFTGRLLFPVREFGISSAALACLTNDQRLTSKISWSVIVVTLAIALVTINDVDLNKQIAIAGALAVYVCINLHKLALPC